MFGYPQIALIITAILVQMKRFTRYFSIKLKLIDLLSYFQP